MIEKCCTNCVHIKNLSSEYPCPECDENLDKFQLRQTPLEQPTKPPMPPVNSPKDEEQINHPDRYAGGKFECIEVMADVFGEEAVKHFCLLNAFKYIWRQEKKGGVEDIKKAMFYMDYYIKLTEEENETDK